MQSIEALMTTVVTIQRPDGSTDRVQLLGWNNLSDPKRKRGNLKYSIPPELALLLKDSTVFAKLEMEVLRAFTSKYALALYEAVARRVRLKHIFTERFSMDDFRELLGVEADKLTTYGNLNQYAIKPALLEVNGTLPARGTRVGRKSPLTRSRSHKTSRKMRPIYRHRCQAGMTIASYAPAACGRKPPVVPVAQSRFHSTIFLNMTPSRLSEYPSAPVADVTPVGLIELQ